jgi:hypothetical protein
MPNPRDAKKYQSGLKPSEFRDVLSAIKRIE